MICPNCKSNIPEDSKFCPDCGCKLQDDLSSLSVEELLELCSKYALDQIHPNYEKSLVYCNEAAKRGNLEGINKVGMHYMLGWGVTKQPGIAYKYFKNAAEKGLAKAQCNLGNMLLYGEDGVKQDVKSAFHWLAKSEKGGYEQATYNLGFCYYYGWGTEQNFEKAKQYFEKNINVGDPRILTCLGCIFMEGINGRYKDESKAFSLFSEANGKGDLYATYCLGITYINGVGTLQNTSKGVSCIKKAAEAGIIEAQYYYGELLYAGKHVPQNLDLALDYISKAADGGLDGITERLNEIQKYVMFVKLSKMDAEQASKFSKEGLDRGAIPSSLYVTDPHLFYIFNGFYYVNENGLRGKFSGTIYSPDGHTAVMHTDSEGHHFRVDVFHPNGQVACRYYLHDDGLSFFQVKNAEFYNTYGFGISAQTYAEKFLPRYESELQSFEKIRFWGLDVTIS